jgi:hypothetical protein
MNISFLIILKNRINLKCETPNGIITLNLFYNNISSLKTLIKKDDLWEFVIVDFASTDANVDDFLKTHIDLPNMSYKLITLNEEFNKGKGFNNGINYCTYDTVFCLDTDMIIRTYDIFNDIYKYVIEQNKVFFPICFSYYDINHTKGWKRDSGKGNVIFQKNNFCKYIEKNSWGKEDDNNFNIFSKLNKAVREYYNDKFIHQWHPPTEWKTEN